MSFSIFPLYCILYILGNLPYLFRNIRRIVIDFIESKYYINIQSEVKYRETTYLININFTCTENECSYTLFEEVIPEPLRIEIRGLLDYLTKHYPICMRSIK